MRNRIGIVLLTVLLAAGILLPSCTPAGLPGNDPTDDSQAETGTFGNGLIYKMIGKNTCTLSGIGTCPDTVIEIPRTAPDGSRVVGIADFAFQNCADVTAIVIPDTVLSIGNYAFENCTALTAVTIPDSVKAIGNYAFHGCTALTSVKVSDRAETLGMYIFANCSALRTVTLPETLSSIGAYAFYKCAALTDLLYAGGEAQWSAVAKGDFWDSGAGAFTVRFNGSAAPENELEPDFD